MKFRSNLWVICLLTGLALFELALFLTACQETSVPTQLPISIPFLPATIIPPPTFTIFPTFTPSSTFFPSLTYTPSRTLYPSPTPFPTSALRPGPKPTIDRLAEPPLPPNPTQFEVGRHLFWLNCMTCHGDRGQGLTDEFRSLYVEDANCWARGCHAGHHGDAGFPIPTVVPAIISSNGDVLPFQTPEQLFQFLKTTHPPQNPGFMPDSDYWALTAYLWFENGRMPEGTVLGP